jgi:hypothetical protein
MPNPTATAARLALILFGTLGGLLVADFALSFWEPPRLLGKRQLLPHQQPFGFHCYPTNPHGELAPAPKPGPDWKLFDVTVPPTPVPLENLAETPWCVRYAINKQGLRGAAYPPQPATGTVRILGIGDSFAMGEGVPAGQSLFAHLERGLGPNAEVLNAARSGYDTGYELATMRRLIPQLRANRSVVVFLLNDIRLSPELRAKQRWINDLINVRAAQLWRGGERPWWHRSRLLRSLDAWYRMSAITEQTVAGYNAAWSRDQNAENIDKFAAQLAAMKAIPDNEMVLVLYPLLIGLDDYPFAKIHAQVAEIAVKLEIPVFDLAPTFTGLTASDLHVHHTDHHPNGGAHLMAANAVARWLKSLNGFL